MAFESGLDGAEFLQMKSGLGGVKADVEDRAGDKIAVASGDSAAPLVVLGVGASVAAFKAVELLRRFVKAGYRVAVLPTPASLAFVGLSTWESLATAGVYVDTDEAGQRGVHVSLAREADLVVIAPATADLLAKLHAGLAPDMLTNVCLASGAPLVVAPAMHSRMWLAAPTQRNVTALREWGVNFVEPVEGDLSSGDHGLGRLADPETIFARCLQVLSGAQRESWGPGAASANRDWGQAETASNRLSAPEQTGSVGSSMGLGQPSVSVPERITRLDPSFAGDSALADITATLPRIGVGSPLLELGMDLSDFDEGLDLIWRDKRVVITAGGTQEPIDPVRFIGNRSSGLFGVQLAVAFRKAGAQVILVAANVSEELLACALELEVEVVPVSSALQMFDHVKELFVETDVLVMAAAVADYRPAQVASYKLKKSHHSEEFFSSVPDAPGEVQLRLVQNPDILAWAAAKRNREQLVVGFAAETGDELADILQLGREKALRKGADVLLVNRVGEHEGFGDVQTQVFALDAQGKELTRWEGSKAQLAESITRFLAALPRRA